MTGQRIPRSWWCALLLAVVVGLGTSANPVLPSPGRWEADPYQAYQIDGAWILDYLVTYPRTGDRISTSLYLALAESEDTWAAAYLDRQMAALERSAARFDRQRESSQDPYAVDVVLQHYRRLITAGQAGANIFTLLLQDEIGPQLRQQAYQ